MDRPALPPKARNVVFTINFSDGNVTQLLPEEFPSWVFFCVWQLEVGAEGTMHYQGYMELVGQQTWSRLHTIPGP